MARGLSQAMPASTSASDRAGSNARRSRGMLRAPRTGKAPFADALRELMISARFRKRGLDDFLFGQLVAGEVSNDCAVAKHVDVVALLQFVGLGGVPKKSAAAVRLLPDQIIDRALGTDVDAAHRIVHQHDARVRAERAGKQRLLL